MSGTLAGRYHLESHLGTGTAGSVYRATDYTTGQFVAVKILGDASPQRAARLEREGRVLRELGLPGVVRLLDEGAYDGRRFLVTELIDGLPFPGAEAPCGWEALAPIATRLLTILAHVHEAGVLHRDLKPPNVLVDAAGQPTVLDFGLARFVGAHSGLTFTGDVLGTPRYQAPEQVLCNRPVDARADLYAVGVMFYEALAGRSPQPARSLGGIYSARLVGDPPPLRSVAPQVPAAVAHIVDRLVARDPEDRPGSARAVLDDLAGAAPVRPAGHLPWLGPRDPVDHLVAAARAGRSVALTGLRGAGRTRLLAEVDQELHAAGVRTMRLAPGERPFESAREGLDAPEGIGPEALEAALRARLRVGDVVLVDDPDSLDAWTAASLATSGGIVLGQDAAPDATPREGLALGTLSAAALVPLFTPGGADPDHVPPVDAAPIPFAATLLHARTDGLASRVAAEVGAWVAAGLARWSGDHLVISDESLELLAVGPAPDPRLGRRASPGLLSEPLASALAWATLAAPRATPGALAVARGRRRWEVEAELQALVERGLMMRREDGGFVPRADVASLVAGSDDERALALAAIARALPPGTEGRLGRLLAGEAWAEAAAEAEHVATGALEEDGFAVALAAARWGLRAAAASDEPVPTAGLLVLLARAGIAVGTPAAVACARTELRRAAGRDRPSGGAPVPWAATAALLDAVLHQLEGTRAPQPWPPVQSDAALEASRQDLLDAGTAQAPPGGIRQLRADGRRSAARGRPEMAVALFGRALEACERSHEAFPVRLELAEALLDAGACADALRELEPVRLAAERHRLVRYAAHARWIHRAATYRGGAAAEPVSPDVRFVEAAQAIGIAGLTARVCLTEAAMAWRASGYDEAARLARLAVAAEPDPTTPGGRTVATLARALEVACSDRVDPDHGRGLVAEADALPDPAVGVQVRGLVALVLPELGVELVADAEALGDRAGRRGEIRAVLSCAEAIAFCRAAARRRARPAP